LGGRPIPGTEGGRSGLWSAGYEGLDISTFIETLVRAGIDTVADVRLNPISRKPGFSKNRLSALLGEAGIGYRHLRSLGNPKDNRAPFWEGRVREGRAAFRNLLDSEEASRQLDDLAGLARRSRVAVLCFERDEERCHRQIVLEAVQERATVPVRRLSAP
jgi:uncharacterized protein (DUF488 family)